MKLKSLLRSFNVLNILLIAVLLFVLQYLLLPMATVDVGYAPAALKKAAEAEQQAAGAAQAPQAPSLMEYTVIAEQNLFHPERRIPPEKTEAPPLPKPEFVLYGTMISDELTLAYMEDQKAPQSTAGRGKRQTPVKKGESLSGFVLKEVGPEKVVMVRGEEQMDVYLNDTARPKKREGMVGTAPSAPAAVTGTPPPAVPSRAAAVPTKQQPTPPPAAASAAQPQAATAAPPSAPADRESARQAFTDLLKRGRSVPQKQ